VSVYPQHTAFSNAISYLSVHMVLIDKHWKPFGMKDWVVTVLKPEDSLDGSTPPYCVQATISWDKVEDFKEAMARGSEETMADIPKYTNVQPHIWISRTEATCGTNRRAKV
jgi:uncharacterized protein (TIGR02118 family)